MKKLIITGLALLFVLGLVACSSRKSSDYSKGDDYEEYYDTAAKEDSYVNKNTASPQYREDTKEEQFARKVIYNASINIQAKDVNDFYSKLVSYGDSLGGYQQSYSITNYPEYSVIRAEYKIPPSKLAEFIKFIEENSDVLNSSLESDDITESYYDTKIRLETKKNSLQQYYSLLKTAKTVEEIVILQREINYLTEDIEAMEGRLRMWDSLSDMATVSLRIEQKPDIQSQEIVWDSLSFEDMGFLIKREFLSLTNTIYSALQWFVIIVAGYSIVWVALGIGLWVLVRFIKKENRKRAEAFAAKKAEASKKAEVEVAKSDKTSEK